MKNIYLGLSLAAMMAAGIAGEALAAAPQKSPAYARDKEGSFFADKYYYEIISKADKTVRFGIDFGNDQRPYSGDVVVPATVTDPSDNTEYTVVEIGPFAFDEDATRLNSVTLPTTIRRIDQYSFWGTVISELVIPEGVEEIEKESFMEAQLVTLTLPGTLQTLGADIFCDNKQLESVTMTEGIETIGDSMFSGCVKLKEFSLPTTVKHIGAMAFFECVELPEFVIPEGVETIDKYAFSRCQAFTSITLPETALTLGKGVFCDMEYITTATLPEALTEIPEETFSYCASLPSYVIHDNVRSIGTRSFEWCLDLKEITFGAGMESIGEAAFDRDEKITMVRSKAQVPPTGASFMPAVYANARLVVPAGSKDAYQNAEGWKEFVTIQEDDETQGVGELITDGAAAEYFTLEGVRVANPGSGLYLRRSGDKVTKVIIK